MISIREALGSSLGKKYLMAVSGLAMVGFLVTHLVGNLQLYMADGAAFNAYAKALHDLGPLLWAAELGLIGIFVLHVAIAFGLQGTNTKARGSRYALALQTKGGPSYNSVLSRGMILTGIVLGVFIVAHVLHFKYGQFMPADVSETMVLTEGPNKFVSTVYNPELASEINAVQDAEAAKQGGKTQLAMDLYARVHHAFENPFWVAFYVAVMLFLAGHLRHGFWSAFQSLGALNSKLEKPMNTLGIVVGLALGVGFLLIPIYMFVTSTLIS